MNQDGMFMRLMHGVRDALGIDPSAIESGVSPRVDFPERSEVRSGRASGATYGSPVDPMLTNPSARIQSLPLPSAVESLNRGTFGVEHPTSGDMPWMDPKIVAKLKPSEGRVTQETADALYQAYLAAQRSAVAMLGFDPRHMVTSPSGEYEASVSGAYAPEVDKIWTQAEGAASNPVHESMHRGFDILRKSEPKSPDIPSSGSEERVVRELMANTYGNVEEKRNPEAVKNARDYLENNYSERQRLSKIEKMAADLIAKRHPAGPR